MRTTSSSRSCSRSRFGADVSGTALRDRAPNSSTPPPRTNSTTPRLISASCVGPKPPGADPSPLSRLGTVVAFGRFAAEYRAYDWPPRVAGPPAVRLEPSRRMPVLGKYTLKAAVGYGTWTDRSALEPLYGSWNESANSCRPGRIGVVTLMPPTPGM